MEIAMQLETNKSVDEIYSAISELEMPKKARRIGIVGFGHLGRYLVQKIAADDDFELAFVWNRTAEVLEDDSLVPADAILKDLDDFAERNADMIVEVAHPCISDTHGVQFLEHADYLIGSPTALSDPVVESKLREAAFSGTRGLYVPSGAFWGGEDIKKMADRGALQGLKVTVTKHPSCFRLHPNLQWKVSESSAVTLYEGAVRDLCPLAPNNVNAMAAAAIAGHNLGFDEVQACLIADPEMTDFHVVEVDAYGPGTDGRQFHVRTVRRNPSQLGRVTGDATYDSFYSSLVSASPSRGCGVHFC